MISEGVSEAIDAPEAGWIGAGLSSLGRMTRLRRSDDRGFGRGFGLFGSEEEQAVRDHVAVRALV